MRRVRSLASLGVALLALAPACAAHDPLEGSPDPVEAARLYVEDAAARRRALEASADVDTPYAAERLAHYGEDWEALPVFAPRVRRVRVDGGDPEEGGVVRAPWDGASLEGWERAGAEAFERYPAELDLALEALRDPAEAERAGLTIDGEGVVRGLVEVETEAGWLVALTCEACHAAEREGVLVRGVPNERIALGALHGADWPRGTLDVTADGAPTPVRPSDLRPIVHQARLHHAGNLANGRLARMVRIETLLVSQRSARARPERRVVAAIALHLESLARTLPAPDPDAEGAALFASRCAGCHAGEGLAGDVVASALVGTDPAASAAGTERGTLGYRAPSLLGVADRRALLHDGSAADLEAILGLAPSTHEGHRFGLELAEGERRAIVAWLAAR